MLQPTQVSTTAKVHTAQITSPVPVAYVNNPPVVPSALNDEKLTADNQAMFAMFLQFCRLLLQGKTITRALRQRTMQAATIPQYHTYLCRRYQWDEAILPTIDWEIYHRLVRKYGDSWTTMVKHLHDISPTGHIAHRNNPSLSSACPACHIPQEDNTHVMLCLAPTRTKWRATLLYKLRKWDDTRSDPVLIDILQDGIRCYFKSTRLNSQAYPLAYQELITNQTAIAWNQLFKARWSHHWARLQNEYHQRRSTPPMSMEGTKWVTSLGRLCLDSWFDLWKL